MLQRCHKSKGSCARLPEKVVSKLQGEGGIELHNKLGEGLREYVLQSKYLVQISSGTFGLTRKLWTWMVRPRSRKQNEKRDWNRAIGKEYSVIG